jgi:hypothetical protein
MKRFSLAVVLSTVSACGSAPPAPRPETPLPEPGALPARPDFPDPFVGMDGRKVETREQWFAERRPELRRLFQHYMYGYFPPAPKLDAKVGRTDPIALGGKATLKEVAITVAPGVWIDLLLVVPNRKLGPSAPCVLGLNFNGNHAVLPDPQIPLARGWVRREGNKAVDADRGKDVATWSIEQSIDRGYAIATFYNGDIDPDRHDWTDGIHPHFLKAGQKPGPHFFGTIAAWAWGLHRAVDYLVTDKDLDPKRIAVFGHSRNGKTALLAAAYDDRIALAIPHQAGCGGTAPSRSKNPAAETVKRINTSFPHWFNDTFTEFNDAVEKLPFDQHGLVAICAPRPVFFTNAIDDQWANPSGQFQILQAADPVYRIVCGYGLDPLTEPKVGDPPALSRLGYWIRAGKHSTTPEDWKVFLDYCDKQMK